MWGCRPRVANRTRASVRRRSNASGRTGQRTASSRFQNGSRSAGSWSRIASPRSRRSRPGVAWTRASWRSSRRSVAASTRGRRAVFVAGVGTSRPRYRAPSKTTAGWTGGPSHHLRDPGYDRGRSLSPTGALHTRGRRRVRTSWGGLTSGGAQPTARAVAPTPAVPAPPAAQAPAAARPARSVRWAREGVGPGPHPCGRRPRPPPDARGSPPRPPRLPPDTDRVHGTDLPRGRHRPPPPEAAGAGPTVGGPVSSSRSSRPPRGARDRCRRRLRTSPFARDGALRHRP